MNPPENAAHVDSVKSSELAPEARRDFAAEDEATLRDAGVVGVLAELAEAVSHPIPPEILERAKVMVFVTGTKTVSIEDKLERVDGFHEIKTQIRLIDLESNTDRFFEVQLAEQLGWGAADSHMGPGVIRTKNDMGGYRLENVGGEQYEVLKKIIHRKIAVLDSGDPRALHAS